MVKRQWPKKTKIFFFGQTSTLTPTSTTSSSTTTAYFFEIEWHNTGNGLLFEDVHTLFHVRSAQAPNSCSSDNF
jgi:hypothetical protein